MIENLFILRKEVQEARIERVGVRKVEMFYYKKCEVSSHDETPLVTKNIPLKIGFGSYFNLC